MNIYQNEYNQLVKLLTLANQAFDRGEPFIDDNIYNILYDNAIQIISKQDLFNIKDNDDYLDNSEHKVWCDTHFSDLLNK